MLQVKTSSSQHAAALRGLEQAQQASKTSPPNLGRRAWEDRTAGGIKEEPGPSFGGIVGVAQAKQALMKKVNAAFVEAIKAA